MSGLGTLALILPLLGSGARVDVGSAVESSSRAGLIPLAADEGGVISADSALTFLAGSQIVSERTSFRVLYSPRLFAQAPGTIELGRPLFLHTLGANYRSALTRRTSLGLDLTGSAGEVSYSYLGQVLEPGTSSVTASTIPLFLTSATAQLEHSTSPRNSVNLALGAGYQAQPEILFGNAEEGALPATLNSSITLADLYGLTLRDTLGLTARGSHIEVMESSDEASATLGDMSIFGAALSWQRRTSPRSDLTLEGGGEFSYATELGSLSFIPNAVVTHVTNFRATGQEWESSASGGVRGFLDRATATYRSQGFGSWTITGRFGSKWSSGLSLFGSTSLAPEPLFPAQFESVASLEQPTSFQISPNTSLQFGARASVRAAHFEETELRPQGELTGFLSITHTLGSDRERGAWLR